MSTKKSLASFKDAFEKEVKLGDKVAYIKCAYQAAGYIHHGTVKRITEQGAWIIPDKKYKDDASGKKVYKMDDGSVILTSWKPWRGKIVSTRNSIVFDCYYAPFERIVKY